MLMNNNTFYDPKWRETFAEINDAGLTIIDSSGYDARLIEEEHAQALKNIKRIGYLHTAWDYPDHEEIVMRGLINLKKAKVNKVMVYVLIGHTSPEQDLYRVIKIHELGFDPYVMSLDENSVYQKRFERWCNNKIIFKSCEWKDYKYNVSA